MDRTNNELQRKVIAALLETKAVDFKAVGSVMSEFGNSLALAEEGEPNICGIWPRHVVRLISLTNPGAPLEQIEELRAVASQLTRAAAAGGLA